MENDIIRMNSQDANQLIAYKKILEDNRDNTTRKIEILKEINQKRSKEIAFINKTLKNQRKKSNTKFEFPYSKMQYKLEEEYGVKLYTMMEVEKMTGKKHFTIKYAVNNKPLLPNLIKTNQCWFFTENDIDILTNYFRGE